MPVIYLEYWYEPEPVNRLLLLSNLLTLDVIIVMYGLVVM